MKVVAAMDSFKGSLSSIEAGQAVREGILSFDKSAEIAVFPAADGGEGTVDAIVSLPGWETVEAAVTGPLGEPVAARYGVSGTRAVIEMASAAGLPLVPEALRNPLNTTTFGVGELIADAVGRGCREFTVGIGGSATNDGGLGMLSALGFEFSDTSGSPAGIFGRDVCRISRINTENVLPELKNCRFTVACDVKNPLCGSDGASAVYGPQKGASPETVLLLDRALESFAQAAAKAFGRDMSRLPGSGAAGGLGWAFSAFLSGELVSGIDAVLDAVGIDAALKDADFAVTGEGRLDAQTAMGKTPAGVAARAAAHGVPVIALGGCVSPDASALNEKGICAFFPIIPSPCTAEKAMEPQNAKENLRRTAEQVFRLAALKK